MPNIYLYMCCCLALEKHRNCANMPIHFIALVVHCIFEILVDFLSLINHVPKVWQHVASNICIC